MKYLISIITFGFIGLLTACNMRGGGTNALPASGNDSVRCLVSGDFLLQISDGKHNPHLTISHRDNPGKLLLETAKGVPMFSVALGKDSIRMDGVPEGSFDIHDKIIRQTSGQTIDSVYMVDTTLLIRGRLTGLGNDLSYRLSFFPVNTNQLRFSFDLEDDAGKNINRIFLRYASDRHERFFGFGQQLTHFDQKGKLLPILVQEHGVGRGKLLLTQYVNVTQNHGGGNPYTTGAPAPQYITTRGRSMFLENKEYSEFDLRKQDRVEIKLFSNRLTGRIVYGKKPLDQIEAYTAYTGRMRKLPEWIHEGVIVGLQGGTQAILKKLSTLDSAGVKLSGLWVQDWSGKRVTSIGSQLWWNWKLDTTLYPGWSKVVEILRSRNVRMLTYINPFLSNAPGHDSLFVEAKKNRYLVTQQGGSPYLIRNTDFQAGLIDLSNPSACTWIKNIIKTELINHSGASGWMADFGEALPFNAVLYNGADPGTWHNRYAEKWAEVNREAIDEMHRDDIVFFNRSGFTQSPGSSTLFWLGDQLQTWDVYDGFKTAVVGMLSGGVSGFSLIHSDIGGYNAFVVNIGNRKIKIIGRSKELLMRWQELGVFNTVFRTHEGLNPSVSAQFDSDSTTLHHFVRMSKMFQALGFYRKQLVREASEKGYPVVRHPFLEFPDDPNTYAIRYQFMYGSEFMVAPVLEQGAKEVSIYLPKGSWVNLWTGECTISGGTWIKIAAPLGSPAIFYKQNSVAARQFIKNLNAEHIF